MESRYFKKTLHFLIIVSIVYVMLQILPTFMSIVGFLYEVLLPFLIAAVFAFILHTTVDKIERYGVHRSIAVTIVFVFFIYVIVFLISNLIPIISRQLVELNQDIPNFIKNLENMFNKYTGELDFLPAENRPDFEQVTKYLEESLSIITALVMGMLQKFINSIGVIFLTPIITFYLLYEWNNISKKIHQFLTEHNLKILKSFMIDLDYSMGAYFRGLILVMNILTIISTISFMIIGIDYPLLFGVIIGITNIVPIIGPYIGGSVVAIYAATKSIKLMISVIILVMAMQLIESNILTPYIQSKSVKTHPLFILLAFIVFGKLFGFIGMVFAIPLLGVILLSYKYIKIYYTYQKDKKHYG